MKTSPKSLNFRATTWKSKRSFLQSTDDIFLRNSTGHSYGFMDTCRICNKEILRKGQSRPRICLDCEKKKAKPIHDRCKDCLQAIIRSNVRKARLCPKCKKQREKLRHEASCAAFSSFSVNPLFANSKHKKQFNQNLLWLRFYTAYSFFHQDMETSWSNPCRSSRHDDKVNGCPPYQKVSTFPPKSVFVKIPAQRYNSPEDIVLHFTKIICDNKREYMNDSSLVTPHMEKHTTDSILVPQINLYSLSCANANSRASPRASSTFESMKDLDPGKSNFENKECHVKVADDESRDEPKIESAHDMLMQNEYISKMPSTEKFDHSRETGDESTIAITTHSICNSVENTFANLINMRRRITCVVPSGTNTDASIIKTESQTKVKSITGAAFIDSKSKQGSDPLMPRGCANQSSMKVKGERNELSAKLCSMPQKALSQPDISVVSSQKNAQILCKRSKSARISESVESPVYIPKLISCSVPKADNMKKHLAKFREETILPATSEKTTHKPSQNREYAMLEKTLKSIGDQSQRIKQQAAYYDLKEEKKIFSDSLNYQHSATSEATLLLYHQTIRFSDGLGFVA